VAGRGTFECGTVQESFNRRVQGGCCGWASRAPFWKPKGDTIAKSVDMRRWGSRFDCFGTGIASAGASFKLGRQKQLQVGREA
jgi:hypothetical protein